MKTPGAAHAAMGTFTLYCGARSFTHKIEREIQDWYIMKLKSLFKRIVEAVAMSEWTFLTNHAQVLLCVVRNGNGRLTAREIAEIVGVTERAVQRILDDLENAGYISRFRDGRTNRYEIHPELPMRHPAQRGRAIRDLLELLALPDW